MHCFSASSVSCVTERLSGCKDTDLSWIRANYYLKKYYSTVAFFDNFNCTTSCITVNELQTMGNVSNGLHNLKADKIRKRISHYFGLQPIVLESWITSLIFYQLALLPPFKSVEQSSLVMPVSPKKKTFVEQTNRSPNDYEKVASDSIVKVPLQTIHEPEVIWNDNSDKQNERLR